MFRCRDAKGWRHVGRLGVDITERIRAEEALAHSRAALETRVEERMRDLLEAINRRQESIEIARVTHGPRVKNLDNMLSYE